MTDFNALLDGYRRFRDERWTNDARALGATCRGQSPKVMVIACSDAGGSRHHLRHIAGRDVRVVRNVAKPGAPLRDRGRPARRFGRAGICR
jgi:carbonic anhydrase